MGLYKLTLQRTDSPRACVRSTLNVFGIPRTSQDFDALSVHAHAHILIFCLLQDAGTETYSASSAAAVTNTWVSETSGAEPVKKENNLAD